MATTPPPPSEIPVPPTPRHGPTYDSYEPYAPRQSARLASQRISRERHSTPPPSLGTAETQSGLKNTRKEKLAGSEILSPPKSVRGSSRNNQSGRHRDFMPTHSLATTSSVGIHDNADLLESEPQLSEQSSLPTRATITGGMLPTPAKTPRKKAVGDVSSASRTLFPPSSASGRSRKHKKASGYSLESFSDDPNAGQSKIEIYTDSRDRIPEIPENEGGLFYKPDKIENNSDSISRPSRQEIKEKREKGVDEALERDDGMIYVFRGKKIFRKFQDDSRNDDDDDNDLGLLASRPDLIDSSAVTEVRSLSRSSIKPRALFTVTHDRSSQGRQTSDNDEEATTDIEDHILPHDDAGENENLEEDEILERPVTPPAKSTVKTPASPGATMRSSRSRSKREGVGLDRTPTVSETRKKHASPFDGWLRKKQAPTGAVSKPKKRDAETIGGPSTKKPRGNRATAASSTA